MQAKGRVGKLKAFKTSTGKDKFSITLEGGISFTGWGVSPYKEGDDVEFEFEDNQWTDPESQEVKTFHNIKQKGARPATINQPNPKMDELVKILAMPKIHIGLTQEVASEIIKAGSYDKVLTKTFTINLTVNPENIDPQKIAALMDIAEAEIACRIIGMKSQGAKRGSELDTSVDRMMKEQLSRKTTEGKGTEEYFGAKVVD